MTTNGRISPATRWHRMPDPEALVRAVVDLHSVDIDQRRQTPEGCSQLQGLGECQVVTAQPGAARVQLEALTMALEIHDWNTLTATGAIGAVPRVQGCQHHARDSPNSIQRSPSFVQYAWPKPPG